MVPIPRQDNFAHVQAIDEIRRYQPDAIVHVHKVQMQEIAHRSGGPMDFHSHPLDEQEDKEVHQDGMEMLHLCA